MSSTPGPDTSQMDVFITSGTTLQATTALKLLGGDIEGSGTLQAEGTITVNGTSATDKPTLKTMLKVGDGTAATTMTFASGSQPMVVSGGGARSPSTPTAKSYSPTRP